ncbi:hypothetical protein ASE59_09640 [Sphingomonas sp. Leaf10]|nr:hypothetical protein ASE59_09640 [Sphingomonas sp. Leaf10]
MEMRPITTAIDAATDDAISRVAAARGITRDEFAADAIRRAVRADEELTAFVQVGIDAADQGELIPQDVVFAELRERRRRLRNG